MPDDTDAPPEAKGPSPAAPSCPDDLHVIVYDGHCGMCSAWVRLVLKAEGPRGRHRFASAQSPLGEALYRRFGHSADSLATLLLVEDGRCRTKADAVLAILASLGGGWGILAKAVRLAPIPWLDRGYDLVARNRYRVWGRLDACRRPPPGMEGRFLS